MRVKIVETNPHGVNGDCWLLFSNGESMIIGGDLRTDPAALCEAVEDQLGGALILPARVHGKALAGYLLDRQRLRPSRRRAAAPRGAALRG